MKNRFLKNNLSIILPICALLVISLLNMYGASFISSKYEAYLVKQSLWIIVGLISMFIVYKLDTRLLGKYSLLFYILGVISLILVLFIGHNINGASSWFKIGDFSIQPSEIFKFFYIVYASKLVTKYKGFKLLTVLLIITFIPSILIFLEPDTGVVLMYVLMFLGIILASPIPKKYFAIMIFSALSFLVVFFLLYFFNSDVFVSVFGTGFFYRVDRLLSFNNSSSFQISRALIGIGTSGLLGFGLSSSKVYIPEAPTDFVFDLTICNFGYIAGFVVVLIYAYILLKLYNVFCSSNHLEDRVIVSGILSMMSFQVVEHILMNLSLTPITGITLPFLSYGGSSMLSYFMLYGLVLKITTNNSSYN